MTKTYQRTETAVSPVVGVMLMLVVTIIIAAVVSAFAGGAVTTQKKVPAVTIQAKFSVSNGMQISHLGGDPVSLYDTQFVIHDSPLFGPNLEQITSQVIDKSTITDSNGTAIISNGAVNVPAFMAGDTLYIAAANAACNPLQTVIAPTDAQAGSSQYSGTDLKNWSYCIENAANIGKTFSLEMDDNQGNRIARTDVVISP